MARSDLIDLTALIDRGGQVVMRMLPDVQQRTIESIIDAAIRTGSPTSASDDDIHARLTEWGLAPHATSSPRNP